MYIIGPGGALEYKTDGYVPVPVFQPRSVLEGAWLEKYNRSQKFWKSIIGLRNWLKQIIGIIDNLFPFNRVLHSVVLKRMLN